MTDSQAHDGDWQVTRRVPLASPLTTEQQGRLADMCASGTGIRAIDGRPGATRLKVRYDASQTAYGRVIEGLREQGLIARRGRWPRLLAAWYGWQDANLRDTAALPERSCCNRPPQRHR